MGWARARARVQESVLADWLRTRALGVSVITNDLPAECCSNFICKAILTHIERIVESQLSESQWIPSGTWLCRPDIHPKNCNGEVSGVSTPLVHDLY